MWPDVFFYWRKRFHYFHIFFSNLKYFYLNGNNIQIRSIILFLHKFRAICDAASSFNIIMSQSLRKDINLNKKFGFWSRINWAIYWNHFSFWQLCRVCHLSFFFCSRIPELILILITWHIRLLHSLHS